MASTVGYTTQVSASVLCSKLVFLLIKIVSHHHYHTVLPLFHFLARVIGFYWFQMAIQVGSLPTTRTDGWTKSNKCPLKFTGFSCDQLYVMYSTENTLKLTSKLSHNLWVNSGVFEPLWIIVSIVLWKCKYYINVSIFLSVFLDLFLSFFSLYSLPFVISVERMCKRIYTLIK